jgi:beta-glucosidase/6-phospho-beta-glucosidase/beta-galactosidase
MTEWEQAGKFRRGDDDPRVGEAPGHWDRWEQDFALLKELGFNSYRLSVEWARIESDLVLSDP